MSSSCGATGAIPLPALRGRRLAVGRHAERDGALGDRVGELAPGVDELVEVLVQRLERPTDDRPVQLFAEQRQVDELDERRLQLASGPLAPVLVHCRQIRVMRDGRHARSFRGLGSAK